MSGSTISVIIPCKDDMRVVRCAQSVGSDARVVVVFNGSPPGFVDEVRCILKERADYISLKDANLSRALEVGIWSAPTEHVLLMDSDCTFAPGSLSAFQSALLDVANRSSVFFKGSVWFRHNGSPLREAIARSRSHHTAEVLTAYKPPLAFAKQAAQVVGGYFFDPRLRWREDADLDARIRAAGLEIVPVPDGVIYHDELDLFTDLRSTFRYGVGDAIAEHLSIPLTDVPRSARSTLRTQGLLPAAYMVFRNRVFDLGKLYMRIRIWLGYERFDA